MDETEYLLSSEANAKRLLESVEQLETFRKISEASFTLEDAYRAFAGIVYEPRCGGLWIV